MSFEFKHPTKYRTTKNNSDKKMLGKGDLSEKENLIELARESAAEEKNMSDFMDMEYGKALLKYLDNNPGKTEDDFKELFRTSLESGGKVINFADYAKAKDSKIKEISLASLFAPGKTLAELTPSERDTVSNLLKMTFGKKD